MFILRLLSLGIRWIHTYPRYVRSLLLLFIAVNALILKVPFLGYFCCAGVIVELVLTFGSKKLTQGELSARERAFNRGFAFVAFTAVVYIASAVYLFFIYPDLPFKDLIGYNLGYACLFLHLDLVVYTMAHRMLPIWLLSWNTWLGYKEIHLVKVAQEVDYLAKNF